MAVVTCDPVTARMAGPAIRAWHMAEVLHDAGHDVQLGTIESCDRRHPSFPVRHLDTAGVRELEHWCEVLVFQGGLLRIHPFLLASAKVVVADVYDPFHLENLEQTRGRPDHERHATVDHLVGVLNEQLCRGDFFLAATARQRDFWIGSLAALGRVNPSTYDEDETLASLVAVVPFGLPPAPPARRRPVLRGVVPGIGHDDDVLLWAGGVYNWFDPLTLVHAVDRLRHRRPAVRLFFLGLQHPNPAIPRMRTATELRELSGSLGLTGTHVFFNEGWVDYEARADYLLEADVGVSTHLDHLETSYSFRTRMLDYLWAGLPMVATGGDSFADLITAENLGEAVPPGDVARLESALYRILADPELKRKCRLNSGRVAGRFAWPTVLAPLVEFCARPRRAPDLMRPPPPVPPVALPPARAPPRAPPPPPGAPPPRGPACRRGPRRAAPGRLPAQGAGSLSLIPAPRGR